jgi:ribosomal protein S18 acetylase RimI-like enzyme
MTDDLARIHDFLLKNDLLGERVEPFRWGQAVFDPRFPKRHDSNYVRVVHLPDDVDAPTLAAETERVQGAAGLGHRCILVLEGERAERLVPGFATLGWSHHCGIVMLQRRPVDRDLDTSRVVETDAETLYAARAKEILTYPWGSPEIARQMLGAREAIPAPTRDFAIFTDGQPVAWVELCVDGDVAQIEALATIEGHRRRGHAAHLMLHAMREAQRSGARLVFLCAHLDDWPHEFYERLGFDEIGRYARFTRLGKPT